MSWHDVPQTSNEWLAMRCGSVSASHMCDVLAKLKRQPKEGPAKEAAARRAYRKQKIRENLTGLTAETYVSPSARRKRQTKRMCGGEQQAGG